MYDMEKEERVLDNLRIYVKYDKSITREQAEETIDFIMELENKIDELEKENEKIKKDYSQLVNFDYFEEANTERRTRKIIDEMRKELKEENKKLHSIIEEVREYIINNLSYETCSRKLYTKEGKELLEILDKEKE